jgi:LmbE family N-acetylglucosaminyl deacetylase
LKQFQDGFMPYVGAEVKAFFEQELKLLSPDLIFTHSRNDAHQDHRLVSELTWNTFRNHLILEYEIPKYDGDLGRPNVFVPLCSDISRKKVRYLMNTFESQRVKHWFQEDTFFSLMRLRGVECSSPSGHAEAFSCRKLVL